MVAAIAFAAATAVPIAIVLAFVVGHHGHVRVSSTALNSASGDIMQSFAALRRSRTSADALPAAVKLVPSFPGRVREFGLTPDQSRRVAHSQATTVWLLPGRRESCVVALSSAEGHPVGSTLACSPTAELANQGLIEFGGSDGLFAVLPDGSHDLTAHLSDGSSVRLFPDPDGGVIALFARAIRDVSFTTRDGRSHEVARGSGRSPNTSS
jgi:hypothetical protein